MYQRTNIHTHMHTFLFFVPGDWQVLHDAPAPSNERTVTPGMWSHPLLHPTRKKEREKRPWEHVPRWCTNGHARQSRVHACCTTWVPALVSSPSPPLSSACGLERPAIPTSHALPREAMIIPQGLSRNHVVSWTRLFEVLMSVNP